MGKLGQLLVARGWITVQQLTRALQNQRGRRRPSGDLPVEMEAISEENLLKGLAEQLGVPAVAIDDLRGIPDEVLAVLPDKLARRCRAIPFRVVGSRLDVAMMDPRNLACQDEIAFASGKRVKVHVAHELRILEALETLLPGGEPVALQPAGGAAEPGALFLGAPGERGRGGQAAGRHRRAAAPDRASERAAAPAARARSAAARRGAPAPLGRRAAAARTRSGRPRHTAPRLPDGLADRRGARAAGQWLPGAGRGARSGDAFPGGRSGSSSSSPGPGARPSGAQSSLAGPALPHLVDEAEKAFESTSDREEVGRIALGFLGRSYRRTALFQVARDRVSGWMAQGEVDLPVFQRFSVGFEQPSLFLNLRQGSGIYIGPMPAMPAHRELARAWGGELPRDCVLLPVRVSDRLVAVIYADGGSRSGSKGMGGVELAQLQRLAASMSAALERCILHRKRAEAKS